MNKTRDTWTRGGRQSSCRWAPAPPTRLGSGPWTLGPREQEGAEGFDPSMLTIVKGIRQMMKLNCSPNCFHLK